jgi:glycosyltransferase involved in cell wall biosynthesis
MHILFLSRWYPYPPDNGSRIRIFNLLKYLSQKHDITLLAFADDTVSQQRRDEMRRYCERVEVVHYKAFQPSSLKAVLGYLSSKPRSFIDTFSAEFQALVGRVSHEAHYDVVIATQFDMLPYALSLRDIPKILEELEISIFHDAYMQETNPLKKARKGLMWGKWKHYLHEVLPRIDGVTVVSEPEADALRAAVPDYRHVVVIPNGADVAHFTGSFGQPEPYSLVYNGALSFYVNFDAVQYFAAEILPRILLECPQTKLYVTGRLEGVAVEEIPNREHIVFTGYLDDIRPRVANSWVDVVSVRMGGGTRLKMLEAMALGTPIVSTTRGITGFDVTPGHDILVADEPQAFADAVVRILTDPALRQSLSDHARHLVEARYDWQVIGQQLEDFVESAVSCKTKVR